MPERTDWPDSRIDGLEQTIRAFAPTAAQIARLEASMEGLDGKVDDLKDDIQQGRKSVRNTLLLILGPVATSAVVAVIGVVVDRFTG